MNKELLDLYADYLISSLSQTTATGLSRLLGGAITHDSVTNFLAESELNSKELWKLSNVRLGFCMTLSLLFSFAFFSSVGGVTS